MGDYFIAELGPARITHEGTTMVIPRAKVETRVEYVDLPPLHAGGLGSTVDAKGFVVTITAVPDEEGRIFTTTILDDALEQLRTAIDDEGPEPTYHRVVMARHVREWPTLWAAIDRLLGRVPR